MKLQATIGVSRLVGEGISAEETAFRHSLECIVKQAYSEKDEKFAKQVEELTKRLFLVLSNSIKIDNYKYDPEMTADLYYEISQGYNDSPDLKVAWLHSLASLHAAKGNLEEAAQCRIHMSAIISEFLKLVKPLEAIHVEKQAFKRLSPNIAQDLIIPSGIGKDEGICQTADFTRKGLIDQLKDAANMLRSSDLFESAIEVERFIAAIYKKNRNYKKLVECYSELTDFCDKIVKSNQTNSRLFGNYYRVAFFGDLLPELDGKEFIYKEQAMVRLSDIAERIKQQYITKFGPKVIMLPNKPVDKATLQSGNIYLQLVSVEEYLDPEELKTRLTPFERKFNLNRFIFETPFTKEGKQQGDFKEQYKRKTILKTELPFPYVKKKRIIVKEKK